jgi:hypothetical protein
MVLLLRCLGLLLAKKKPRPVLGRKDMGIHSGQPACTVKRMQFILIEVLESRNIYRNQAGKVFLRLSCVICLGEFLRCKQFQLFEPLAKCGSLPLVVP